jgi:CRP-like cAMP-binding protein
MGQPSKITPQREHVMTEMPSRSHLRKNLKALRQRLEKRPLDLDARMRTARTHRLLKQNKQAISHYHAVARYLSLAGRPLQAVAVLKELLQLDPSHKDTLLFLAKLYARTRAADASNRGRVAVPILEIEDGGAIALPEGLPLSTTGIWRAIRPQSTDVYTVLHEAKDVPEVSVEDDLREVDDTLDLSHDDIIEETLYLDDGDGDGSTVAGNKQPDGAISGPTTDENSDPFLRLSDAEGFEFLGEIQTEDVILPKVPFFSSLSEQAFMELGHAMVFHRAEPGEDLFKENDTGDSCIVISRGKASATRIGQDGRPVSLMQLTEGDFAGVFALLAAEKRQATLTALTSLEYFEIDRIAIQKIISAHPSAQEALDAFVRERLLLNILATFPVSSELSMDQRQELAQAFTPIDWAAEQPFKPDNLADNSLFVLISGEMEITNNKNEQEALLGMGDYFGIVGRAETDTLDYQIKTRSAVTLLQLSAEKSLSLFKESEEERTQLTDRLSGSGMMFGRSVFAGNGRLPTHIAVNRQS